MIFGSSINNAKCETIATQPIMNELRAVATIFASPYKATIIELLIGGFALTLP